ncbi:MAG: hypothetical protein ACJ72E_03780 [Marmoricola sp.]
MRPVPVEDPAPFWEVWAIHDPDGGGGDFSYTCGLHDRGFAELWIAGRPALGEDPGFDWCFSQRDTCGLLNEFAADWLAGRLRVGDEIEREYDGGLVTVRFRVDPPGDRDELEALGIAAGAEVVPIRWSLHRPDPGPNAAMTRKAQEEARARFRRLLAAFEGSLAGLPGLRGLPGWEVPARPRWSPGAKYGPRTSVVLAHAAYFWTCDGPALKEVFDAAFEAEMHGFVGYGLACVAAAARVAGREEALMSMESDLLVAVEMVGWSIHADERDDVVRLLSRFLNLTLGAELVADFLAPDVTEHVLDLLVDARRST